MKLLKLAFLLFATGALMLLAAQGSSADYEAIERLSVDSSGAEGNSYSHNATISADGRYVTFDSNASNLVPGDTNNRTDVFWRDLQTGTIERVSVSSTGGQGNGYSQGGAISPDGRYVAFYSAATNLVENDTNGVWDVFLHDTSTGVTTRVSVDSNGTEAIGGRSQEPDVSSGGQFVTFISDANNLVADDTSIWSDIFVRDTVNNITTRIMGRNGEQPNNSTHWKPSITPDGRYVAFSSRATNLVSIYDEDETYEDVFVHDRLAEDPTDPNEMISVRTDGWQCILPDGNPDISDDGNYVVWKSDCNLDQSVLPQVYIGDQIYLRDRNAGTTILASRPDDGSAPEPNADWQPLPLGDIGHSWMPSISGDGRYVTFQSWAINMVADDTNTCGGHTIPGSCPDVFRRDLLAEETRRLSVGNGGEEADDESVPSIGGAISTGSTFVVFASEATNLVSDDQNLQVDVFLWDNDMDNDGLADDCCDLDDDDDGFRDADEAQKGSDSRDGDSTPEGCDGVDNDGDTTLDEAPVGSGRATPDPFYDPAADPDGDTVPNADDWDDDNDDFFDLTEVLIGTDPLASCPITLYEHDAWPRDPNRDRVINIWDYFFVVDKFGANGLTTPKHPLYDVRADLDANGVINLSDLFHLLPPYFGSSCTP